MAELIKWFQQWLKQSTETKCKTLISFLAELHQRFIQIHPFDDGNGCVVGLLINYMLIRLDFLPMILEDRNKYIKAIQFADVGNRKHLENLFKEKIVEMLKRAIHSKNHKMDLNANHKLSTKLDKV